MSDLLADLGRLAWDPFWMPITAWTLVAACALAVMAFVPAREVFLRRDLHFALLLALPAGLVASRLLGGFPGANLLRTWWQGPALVAPVTPSEMTVSPLFEPDPVGIVSIGAPVLESSTDPAVWIGLGTLLAAVVAAAALLLLLVAAVRLHRLLAGATPDGALQLANGREIPILRSDRVQVPFSCGVFRPRIVLPDGPLPDRDVIVAHEAAHHEHRDVARLWSAGLVHAAFVFHPLVHLLSSRISWLMEAACDRATLERTGLPASRYSEVLLRAVPQSAPRALRVALPMGRSVKELRSRIAALGHATNPARRGRVVSVGSLGVFAVALLVVAAAGIAATEAPALATSRVTPPGVGVEADLVAADSTRVTGVLRIQTPGLVAATGQGRITGRVTDGRTGVPVGPGALIYVNELYTSARTQADGAYAIGGIPPGTYTLRFDHYRSLYVEHEVTLSSDESVQVDFQTEGTPVFLTVTADMAMVIGDARVTMDELPDVLRSLASHDGIALTVAVHRRIDRQNDDRLRGGIEAAVGRASRNRYALRWTSSSASWQLNAAQNRQGTVRGRVTRADNGEPLLGASIFVAGTNVGSMSGPNGEYFIQGVPAGRQEVVASFLGFVPTAQRDVNVMDGGTVVLNFALNPQTYPVGEVTVIPPPPPTPDMPQPGVPVNRPGEPETFVIVEQMPELIGGLAGINERIVYPEIARRAGIEGRVIVQFLVEPDGSVSNPAVVRGIGAGCDEEALRVVRTATFKPGMQRGEPVRVKMSLPVTFDLGPANPEHRLTIVVTPDGNIQVDGQPSSPEAIRNLEGIDWRNTLVVLHAEEGAPREAITAVREALDAAGALRITYITVRRASEPPYPGAPPPPDPSPSGDPANRPGEPETFVIVEQMPELIGGIEALQERLSYPDQALDAGVEGRVIVQFLVEPDGAVSDALVVRGIGAGCDEEALRVVRAARFKPGMQRGVPVRVKMSLPINFNLDPANERPRVTIEIRADGSLVVNGAATTLDALRSRTDIDWTRVLVSLRPDTDAPDATVQQVREFLRTPPR